MSVLPSDGAQDRVYHYEVNMTEQTLKTCCPSSPSTSGENDSGGGTLELNSSAVTCCRLLLICSKTSVRLCMCSMYEPPYKQLYGM